MFVGCVDEWIFDGNGVKEEWIVNGNGVMMCG